ncbi:MAG: hypothetical protein JWP15_3073 [Alphaproteobacteria bacterium]|nr:hypothetical protein [Alphaproteobacteria bacterium]
MVCLWLRFSWSLPVRLVPALLACASLPAAAQTLPVDLSFTGDVRIAGADGERAWTDGGFGKTRFGGDRDGDFRIRPRLTEGELIWQPRFGWSTKAVIAVAAQDGQQHAVDLVEAFVAVKPMQSADTRISGRVGLFWPPVSLEHEGAAWQVADMITPSAINSWIGEEVKVVGAEGTISRTFGEHRLSATLGLFGFNDTSGTLLSFRGWAMHDFKTTAFGREKLPTLPETMEYAQAAYTRPTAEIDNRPGFYAKLAWQPPAPVSLEAFYYDNRGDPQAVTSNLLWGWRTRFVDIGARAQLGPATTLTAQALTGTTRMGPDEGQGIWIDTRFRSAFLRLSHKFGPTTFSTRFDLFGTDESGSEMEGESGESGWAATGAGSWQMFDHARLLVELLHVDSRREGRLRDALDPRQSQTIVQTALRLSL